MAKLSHFISHSSRWRSLQLALSFWQGFEKLMLHSWLGTSTEKVVRELDVYRLLLLSVLASAEVATNSTKLGGGEQEVWVCMVLSTYWPIEGDDEFEGGFFSWMTSLNECYSPRCPSRQQVELCLLILQYKSMTDRFCDDEYIDFSSRDSAHVHVYRQLE